MNKALYRALPTWPKGYITGEDLAILLDKSDASRYGLVNRALKEGILTRLHRGLYLISLSKHGALANSYEIAQVLHGPSAVSLESALQYHHLIPEAVYSFTSITLKNSREIETPLGVFAYHKVPQKSFLLGVERVEEGRSIFFMATPWRAIADIIKVRYKNWKSFNDMCDDMRIEDISILKDQKKTLLDLIQNYPNKRTSVLLQRLAEGLDEF